MIEFFDYIAQNYLWILGGIIIIILAIIGRYADKTNFGQGKMEDNNSNKVQEIPKKRINDYLQNTEDSSVEIDSEKNLSSDKLNSKQEELLTNSEDEQIPQKSFEIGSENVNVQEENKTKDKELDESTAIKTVENEISDERIENPDIVENNKLNESEIKFEQLDNELNELLPDKGIITDDLLSDIDDLSVNSSVSFSSKEFIPNLDKIELPKIKEMKEDPVDIWKF